MVHEDYPEGSGDYVDMGQNTTHKHEGQKHAHEQDAKENILSNIRSMMMGAHGTSPTPQEIPGKSICGYFNQLRFFNQKILLHTG